MGTNPARDGWTVSALANYLASYAKDNPDAVVKFTSSESGGYWPADRVPMGVFVSDQCHITDSRLCGGGVEMTLCLMAFPPPSQRQSDVVRVHKPTRVVRLTNRCGSHPMHLMLREGMTFIVHASGHGGAGVVVRDYRYPTDDHPYSVIGLADDQFEEVKFND